MPAWTMFVDGAVGSEGSGAGVVIKGPSLTLKYALKLDFHATNNQAEYEALLAGLQIAKELSPRRLQIDSDSKLVISHVQGSYQAKNPVMCHFLTAATRLMDALKTNNIEIQTTLISREENMEANAVASTAIGRGYNGELFVETVKAPTYDKDIFLIEENADVDWRQPIMEYLEKGELPTDKTEAT